LGRVFRQFHVAAHAVDDVHNARVVVADKFSESVAVTFLRLCDQRCFGFRVVNDQFLFLSIFHLLNEIYVRFIRKLRKLEGASHFHRPK